jgi:hypothetical protein
MSPGDERDTSPPRNETTDASPGLIAAIGGALAALIAASLLISLGISRHRGAIEGRESLFQHGPADRTSIDAAWASAPEGTANAPVSYAWLDRSKGIVRMPISRAIDLICADGGAANRGASP